MWQKLLELGSRLINVTQKMQQHEDDIKQLRQDIKAQNQRIDQMTEAIQRLAFELQRTQENGAHEKELLKLQLENAMLKFERRLPSGTQSNDVEKE